jgi:hypothetical protein
MYVLQDVSQRGVPLPPKCKSTSVTDLSKRDHRHLRRVQHRIPSQDLRRHFTLESRCDFKVFVTIIGISMCFSDGRCSQEKSSASRPTLRPERAGVDADQTALQPDCRKGHSCLHIVTLYVTLQMDSFNISNISNISDEIHDLGFL